MVDSPPQYLEATYTDMHGIKHELELGYALGAGDVEKTAYIRCYTTDKKAKNDPTVTDIVTLKGDIVTFVDPVSHEQIIVNRHTTPKLDGMMDVFLQEIDAALVNGKTPSKRAMHDFFNLVKITGAEALAADRQAITQLNTNFDAALLSGGTYATVNISDIDHDEPSDNSTVHIAQVKGKNPDPHVDRTVVDVTYGPPDGHETVVHVEMMGDHWRYEIDEKVGGEVQLRHGNHHISEKLTEAMDAAMARVISHPGDADTVKKIGVLMKRWSWAMGGENRLSDQDITTLCKLADDIAPGQPIGPTPLVPALNDSDRTQKPIPPR